MFFSFVLNVLHALCIIFRHMFFEKCTSCQMPIGDSVVHLPASRSGFRLLSGTRRRIQFRKKTIKILMEIQSRQCAYCDDSLIGEEYHIDHVIPLSVGGRNTFDNLALACVKCNLFAGSLVFRSLNEKRLWLLERRLSMAKHRNATVEVTNGPRIVSSAQLR